MYAPWKIPHVARDLTTQTATGLRGICGNDELKKCWKSNITERKRPKRTENIIKKFKFRLTCRGSQVRVLYRPPNRKSLETTRFQGFSLFCRKVIFIIYPKMLKKLWKSALCCRSTGHFFMPELPRKRAGQDIRNSLSWCRRLELSPPACRESCWFFVRRDPVRFHG